MRTKLIVLNEHTLGYILPELPNTCQILHSSSFRGSTHVRNSSVPIAKTDKVRLASKHDFDAYKILFKGYENDPNYIYDDGVMKQTLIDAVAKKHKLATGFTYEEAYLVIMANLSDVQHEINAGLTDKANARINAVKKLVDDLHSIERAESFGFLKAYCNEILGEDAE